MVYLAKRESTYSARVGAHVWRHADGSTSPVLSAWEFKKSHTPVSALWKLHFSKTTRTALTIVSNSASGSRSGSSLGGSGGGRSSSFSGSSGPGFGGGGGGGAASVGRADGAVLDV